MMARLAIVTFGLLFGAAASAQPVPSLTPGQPPVLLVPFPVPPSACIWASRVFSEGAEFCFAAKAVMVCGKEKQGKWTYEGSDACNGTPIDAK
jgi:hypothetical protein